MPFCMQQLKVPCTAIALLCLIMSSTPFATADGRCTVDLFEQDYSVDVTLLDSKIEVPTSGGRITAAAAGSTGQRYQQLMIREFRIYPRAFLKASQLKRIIVCSRLAFNGQLRAAIPDFARNTLYLDDSRGSRSRSYQRAVIHHEFFHIVDYQDDGIVYDDVHWKTLNPEDFEYGEGGSRLQEDSSQSGFRNPTNGFLTKYSLAGVEEDKAELFAHLIVSQKIVASAVESDALLDQKVSMLKALTRRFCAELDESFWAKVASRQACFTRNHPDDR